MKLSKSFVEFLINYRRNLSKRSFLIDMFTRVDPLSRNSLVLAPSEFDRLKSGDVIYSYTPPADLMYDHPYTVKEMKENGYSDEVITKLTNDPIHAWRAETGIEMIHREPDYWEFLRIWRNWQVMDDELKIQSDKQSNEFFGFTNAEMFENLLPKYFDQLDSPAEGDIVLCQDQKDNKRMCLAYINVSMESANSSFSLIYLTDNIYDRLFTEIDEFVLPLNAIELPYNVGETTTVGRYITNYLQAVYPFDETHRGTNSSFTYNNGEWSIKNHHKLLVSAMLRENDPITVQEYKRYANMFFFLGSFTELCVPSYTRKSLTTDPKLQEIKMALYLANKEKIDAGDPVAIAALEDALIKIDKAYLSDDPSSRMLNALGGKAYNVARKQVYLTVGGVEEFSKHTGNYDFILRSLSEGWDVKELPIIANNIRKGSFNRGHETQLGGAETKYIVRVFQDYVAKIDDCGTTHGLPVDFNMVNIKNFIGRSVKLDNKDEWSVLTEANLAQFDKKQAILRSPQHCQAKGCICYKCCGSRFAELDIKHVTMILAELTSKFTTMALKAMHGTKLQVYETDSLDQFII